MEFGLFHSVGSRPFSHDQMSKDRACVNVMTMAGIFAIFLAKPFSVLSLIIAYLTGTKISCNHLALPVLVKAHTQKVSKDISKKSS